MDSLLTSTVHNFTASKLFLYGRVVKNVLFKLVYIIIFRFILKRFLLFLFYTATKLTKLERTLFTPVILVRNYFLMYVIK